MRKLTYLAALLGLWLLTPSALAEMKVMASIKPIHSLVASVMEGVDTPGLIVSGSNSPHTYTLKPSDADALSQSQVIFWVGHELEAFLEKPIAALTDKAKTVSLMDVQGIQTLQVREGNGFDHHEHEGEEHADEGHEADPHIWLDPENAKTMVHVIAETLAVADPVNAAKYRVNAEKTMAKVDVMSLAIVAKTAPVKAKGFIVFHDAYHYFEHRFGMSAVGAISIHPENPPGAQSILDIKKRITNGEAVCVFSEPQFDQRLADVIIEGTNARKGILDPEGAAETPGPNLYFNVMEALATSLVDCLSS